MISIVDATVTFQSQPLVGPLHLSSGIIRDATQATASVTVEIDGCRAVGRGTVYLSDLWAWPDALQTHHERDQTLRRVCENLAGALPTHFRDFKLHPLEAGLQLHGLARSMATSLHNPPDLARSMCASPFDAALHDAVGRALNRSAFELYGDDSSIPGADRYFANGGVCQAIHRMLQPQRGTLPAWYVVSDTAQLGGELQNAIRRHGYSCFKLKLTGRDIEVDVTRTVDTYRAALAAGITDPRITVDSNEGNPSVESVLDYLERLRAADAAAFEAVQYLEQPTSRNIRRYPHDWRLVSRLKPVLLDEGLTDLDVLAEAKQQGYSGMALKTCKGHSMLLVCAAWAQQHQMCISLQDLTNPGIALIHAALVGSRLPTINGAELNSPQFTPAANAEFLPRLSDLFEPRNGVHRLPTTATVGLGTDL